MQLKNRYYPYPVIEAGNDSYVNSSFESEVEQIRDGYTIKLIIKVNLVNDEIEKLIKNGEVIIIHHIECPQTCYRSHIETNEKSIEFPLRYSDVNGLVQVCSFLVANKNIEKYTNSLFSNDYQGFKFNIEKGCVMAVGNQFNIKIEKIKDDLANKSSIFSIVKDLDSSDADIKIILSENKIIIKLPERIHSKYCNMQGNIAFQPIMHSMVIVPALMYTFTALKDAADDLYEYSERRWFKGLRKACETINIQLDENHLREMDTTDIFRYSQLLLDCPVCKAIDILCSGEEDDYED